MYAINLSKAGAFVSGNKAPERKNIGTTMKFITSWKPCISSILDAIAIPVAVNATPIEIMNKKAIKIPDPKGIPPTNVVIINMNVPWISEVVAPPIVWPSIIEVLDTGAIRVSFKKPNCLSQMIWIPENILVNRIVIETIPGAMNIRYGTPPSDEPEITELSPKPNAKKKNKGCAREPSILDLLLRYLFMFLSQIV